MDLMKDTDELAQFFNERDDFSGSVRRNEPLKNHTTMGVGGNAKIFLGPDNMASLIFAARTLAEERADFFILGGGSNVVIADGGLDAVISTRGLNEIKILADNADGNSRPEEICGECIQVDCGAGWGAVLSFCKKNDLGGFEPFSGLSGTTGGALYMNATCFGLSACDNLVSAQYFDMRDFKIHAYEKNDSDWGYKISPFQPEGALRGAPRRGGSGKRGSGWSEGETSPFVILSAVFRVRRGFDSQKAEGCLAARKEKGHFLAPSAGSAFKNDAANGIIAGKVIDECGLKGLSVGGAQIAPWHGNLIINPGRKASAGDVRNLADEVRKIVREQTGAVLESEIIFVGF